MWSQCLLHHLKDDPLPAEHEESQGALRSQATGQGETLVISHFSYTEKKTSIKEVT